MAYKTFVSARAKLEATRGAGGTPSRILSITDTNLGNFNQEIITPTELRASYFPIYQAAVGANQPELTISGVLDYSMAGWLGNVAVGTAVITGSTSVTHAFTPSGTVDNLYTAVIELGAGDNIGTAAAFRFAYMGLNELTITWDKASADVTYNATFVGGTAGTTVTSWTGTPTSPTTQLVTAGQTQVYIDSSTIGSTADNNIQSVEWTLNNGWSRLNTLNGTVGPQSVLRPSPRTWTLRLRRYYANTTERTAWNAGTERKIRVLSTGPTLGGSTYKLTADFYGVVKNITQTFVDDLIFDEIELVQYYDTTATTDFAWTVICADTSFTA